MTILKLDLKKLYHISIENLLRIQPIQFVLVHPNHYQKFTPFGINSLTYFIQCSNKNVVKMKRYVKLYKLLEYKLCVFAIEHYKEFILLQNIQQLYL